MSEHVGFELSSWPIEAKDPPVCVTWSCPPALPQALDTEIPHGNRSQKPPKRGVENDHSLDHHSFTVAEVGGATTFKSR
jgi:hypothetical protein